MKIKTAVFFILFGFISLTGQETGKLRKVVFNTSWLPQAQFAGYFVARDKGFYEKYGLKTDFIFGSYDFGVEQNLTEGKADLGIMWLHEGILAHGRNKSIVNIAQFFDSSNIEIVSRSENISSIGVWKPFVKFLSTYIHEEISDSIEIVPLRNGIESFVLGAVDAITVTNYNELNQLINSGIDADELHIYKLAGMGLVLPEDGIYCLRDFYNNNEKLIRHRFQPFSQEARRVFWLFYNNRQCLEVLKEFH